MAKDKPVGPATPSSAIPLRDFSKMTLWEKVLTPNLKPRFEEFPELVDYLTWLRATLAFVYGIWIGVSSSQQKSRAMANIILAFNLVCFMPLAYTMTYLRCDQESYGAKLIFAGVPQGLALVLLVWIYLFTESHGQDEAVFAAAIAKSAVIHAAMGSSSSDSLGENPLEKVATDDVDTATQTTPESEF